MYQTILGHAGFRSGMDLYFQRHDGKAATYSDLLSAMEDANRADLKQFSIWHDQIGTPCVKVEYLYNKNERTFDVAFTQLNQGTCRNEFHGNLHIPILLGLVGPDGEDFPLQIVGEQRASDTTRLLELKDTTSTFRFINIESEPVPSVLRNFSAPIKIFIDLSDSQLAHLMMFDTDSFCRWEASQKIITRQILKLLESKQDSSSYEIDAPIISAFRKVLKDDGVDP